MVVKIDMEMPESCYECDFCDAEDIEKWICQLTKITFPKEYGEESRLKYCPLKECE